MKQTILVIEDEGALQKTLEDVLTQEGYEVLQALNGEVGLRTAEEKLPQLIFLDLMLPKMNGFDVLAKLKEIEETKNIPIIVLTNLEDMEDIQKAIDLGATTYLVKSNYILEDIVAKVKDSLI